ncbi:hypothetical protein Glove_441g89 [Diversispora epigaea]|uniref:Protein kinase domain-containing protein n=1 Tax=Diversispora epigaea TaxID=1348612 RepID=A0A397GWT5_9GLOM|nr:hypothetical protein Glove_441g89 [Diversispora epigaea]
MPTKLINLEIHKIKIRSVPKQLWLEPVKQESRNENEKHEHEKHKHKQHKKNEYNNNNDSNVPGWTCGNLNIDKLIKNSQLQSSQNDSFLEWVPYNRFSNIQYLGQGGFSTVYSALWNNHSQSLRTGPKKVALKRLHNSENICLQFLNEFETSLCCSNQQEIKEIINIYGITQDPESKDYMIVMYLAGQGNLQSYIRNNFNNLTWLKKLEILLDIARGIHSIHRSGLCHKNLHTSNLFYDDGAVSIGDLGLTGYANKVCEYSKEAAGIIQYMAPEILRGRPYTKFADIYGFAMIMSEIASGLPPFVEIPRDQKMDLIYDICDGYRPRVVKNITPKCFETLMKQCWDNDEFNRPNARQIVDSLLKWYKEVRDNNTSSDIYKQFKEADECRQQNLQTKTPLYKYDKYKSQIVETTDLGEEDCLADESGESSDEGCYYGYGADFPALLVHESEDDSASEAFEDLEEYEYINTQRTELLHSWLDKLP